jgi:hypothetical protein
MSPIFVGFEAGALAAFGYMPPETVTRPIDTPQMVEPILSVLGPAGVGRTLLAEALGAPVPDADPLGRGESWSLWLWLWWAARDGGGTSAWEPVRRAPAQGPAAVEAALAALPVPRTRPTESPEDELLRLWRTHPTGPFQRMVLHQARALAASLDGTPPPTAPDDDSAWAEWAAEYGEATAAVPSLAREDQELVERLVRRLQRS